MRARVLLSVYVFLLVYGKLFSLDNVSVRVTPNAFPEDITWEIQDRSYQMIVSKNLSDCQAFVSCKDDFLFDPFGCYRFVIEDKNFDRDADPSRFEVLFNGNVVISRFMTDSLFIGSFNCSLGEICEQPAMLPPDTTRMHWPPVTNYWFSYTPRQTGLFQLLNCDLNEQRRYPPTKLWIYDNCQRELRDGPEGAIAFSEKLSFCPPSSGINAIPLTGGEEYLFRLSLLDTTAWRDSIELTITQFDENPGCTDPAACNYYPFATAEDGSCYYEGCKPDLEIDQQIFESSILFDSIQQNDNCLITEGCLRGPGKRYVIRFSTLIKNIGNADYIIGSPEENSTSFSNDNCHQHYHQLGYAEYLLFASDGSGEPIGFKNGFCVQDSECPTALQRYFCNYMGITAGCEDLYGNDVQCQWVDITDVPDGTYTLVARINWNQLPDIRGYTESTYENNWAQVCVDIKSVSGIPQISILEENCPAYTDCLGFAFGSTEVDCNNVCGGTAHYADVNQSGELEDEDVMEYLNAMADHGISAEPCFDLNRDGYISIYDVVLAADCLEDERINKDNIFHEHCILPAGQFQASDSLRLTIQDIDTLAKTVLIGYTSPQRNIISLQFELEGIDIEQIQLEREPRFQSYNDKEVFIYNRGSILDRNQTAEIFIRIDYRDIDENVCIINVEGVNDLLQEVVAYSGYQSDCSFLTNTADIDSEVLISAYPLPARDRLYVEWGDQEIVSIRLMQVDGTIVFNQKVNNQSSTVIDVSSLAKGLYVIQSVLDDQFMSIQKVVIQ